MSRIGKLPITIPKGVTAALVEGMLTVKGPRGELTRLLSSGVAVEIDPTAIRILRPDDSLQSRSLHGLTRALVSNMVVGVSQGFLKGMEIQGTGYRAEAQGSILSLNLGHSHPIQFVLPDGIKATVERQTTIRLEGIDKELLGQTAAKIRAFRPVEPYKGKGVRYIGERIHRKVGKAGSKK
ncbi:MAG: 50S ribosomal protein L6 [Syntrophobacteraceae bacterium]|jgi:large subunit ribosomal protein L6|nr:50S ribosomal protein L6 [Syntrophobacteraceae bacterium]